MSLKEKLNIGLQALSRGAATSNNPFAQSITNVAVSILESINNSRQTDADLERLGSRILDIALAITSSLQNYISLKDSSRSHFPQWEDVLLHAGEVVRALEKVAKTVLKTTSRGRFLKVLSRSSDALSIKVAEQELEHCVSVLSLHMQIQNLELLTRINNAGVLIQSEVENSIGQAKKKQLAYIKSKVIDHSFKHSDERLAIQILPAAPQIFFGRDSVLEHLITTMTSTILEKSKSAAIAILGPGGIGKTSVALAALHDPQIKNVFEQYRYFISCEAIEDPEALVSALSRLFNLPENQPISHLRHILTLLDAPVLLAIDNLETPWEAQITRQAVETILSQLADIPNLSLLVTLRGAERPLGIPWTRPFLPPLDTLDIVSAKHAFIAISDVPEEDEDLEELVNVVDRVPLAITLMATQAQYQTCAALLAQWKEKKTAMVTRGFKGRLSNLEVSIEVSMSSERLRRCPDATRLLQILSYLPDGAAIGELTSMVPSDFELDTALLTLQQVSLSQRDAMNRLRVLSPVREYVKQNYHIDALAFEYVLNHHASLAKYIASSEHTKEVPNMIQTISPQIGNLHLVILHGLNEPAQTATAIQAVFDLQFYYSATAFGTSTTLLEKALDKAREIGSRDLEANCLTFQASHYPQGPKRKECLDGAITLYRTLGPSSGLLRCLLKYSSFLRLNGEYPEMFKIMEEAFALLKEDTSMIDRAMVYQYQANALMADGSGSQEAIEALKKGLEIIDIKQYPGLASTNYTLLGYTTSIRCLFSRAVEYARHGLELCGGTGWQGSMNLNLLADNLFFQSQISEAYSFYMRAYDLAAIYDDQPMMASLQNDFARQALANGKVEDALIHSHLAIKMFTALDSKTDQARCYATIGQAECARKNFVTAWTHLSEAWKIYRECKVAGSTWRDYAIIMPMGDVMLQTDQLEEAEKCFVVSLLICRKNDIRLGVARCIQRLGDILYRDVKERENARACYEAALDMIRYLGVKRHIGDTLSRLGIVSLLGSEKLSAERYFRTACKFYKDAEYPDGEKYCDARLEDCGKDVTEHSDTLMDLPAPTIIHFL